MDCRDRLETYLRQQRIPHQMQIHPRAYTAGDVAESEHLPGKLMAKVVIGIADGRVIMLVLPASKVVNPHEAVRAFKAHSFRLAHEYEFADIFDDCELGVLHPFGNLYNLPVYVDQTLAEDETIYFRAGTSTETISLKYADFAKLVQPVLTNFAKEVADTLSR
ncbi:MAG: YbaK/EbsC family protein [Chloroflexi bacterium]|uniref:YbaK/EbsC family protein n=1 Tax=Candidatus Chlorohelix allophototropha TaxID=3003348 RepID=A0A8T7M2W0_9CHLR|nr:YbaK/EbsC family protein [Chloroflexota bacterium]WJW67507.1 YbaK/EbsC family protein [Chloroflexota bacterium L227-S17]